LVDRTRETVVAATVKTGATEGEIDEGNVKGESFSEIGGVCGRSEGEGVIYGVGIDSGSPGLSWEVRLGGGGDGERARRNIRGHKKKKRI